MAFFSDALGHSALTGIAIGMMFGIANTNISMIIFAIVFSIILNFVKHKTTYGADTIISVFSSIAIALGLAILSAQGNFSKYSSYLVGDVLGITVEELVYLVIAFVLVIGLWLILFNKLHTVSINSSLAKSKGINVAVVDNIFVIMISIMVMLSIRWIGILLINSLLILPAAASRNVARNIREYHGIAVLISLISGLLGLVLSYYANIGAGPAIVIISGIFYFITFALKEKIKG